MKTFRDIKTSREDLCTIAAIVARAAEINSKIDRLTMMLDLQAWHDIDPLNLDMLLAFPAEDFGHDLYGISKHLNRQTLEMDGEGFSPRCSVEWNPIKKCDRCGSGNCNHPVSKG